MGGSGGGGGGGFFADEKPEDRAIAIRAEEEKTKDQFFESKVSEKLGDLLAGYNERDANGVRALIEDVKGALEEKIEELTISPVFGGSVRKHTYVDGISDVDCLLVIKGDRLEKKSPQEILDIFEQEVHDRFPHSELKRDLMSVTLQKGEVTLQMLPAVRSGKTLYIPSESGKKWVDIRPEAFFRKLTEINQRFSYKVVPVIKLVKGINDTFSEKQKLSGYHVESLAIEAFKDYDGPENSKAMLEHFFSVAKDRVLKPIKDKTGQSLHVDDYLGVEGNKKRRDVSENLARIERSMKNADAIRSYEKWRRIVAAEE